VPRIFKHYWLLVRGAFEDIKAYYRFAAGGNVVKRRTDFARPGSRLVLLLHGFGTTRRSVAILEQRLRDDGYDVFSMNLGGFLKRLNTNGIDDLAWKVKTKVDSLYERYKIERFAVIGHSKGGLIGRYYVSCLGGSEHVHTLITLGTPHNGNWWALLAAVSVIGIFSKSLWQMMPVSRFIKGLRKTPIPEDVRAISIYSRDDEVVPAVRSRLDIPQGAAHVRNIELFGYSHTDYLIKRGVYEVIRNEL
jgi:alpha-beta hydrolase superfamily lysophospholipase